MRFDALSRGSFVHLDAAERKEIVENLRGLTFLCIPSDEVPIRGKVEPPRSIISRARVCIFILSKLWLKIPFLNSKNLRERFPSANSTFGFPSRTSLDLLPRPYLEGG
jgi:hypothetical protein